MQKAMIIFAMVFIVLFIALLGLNAHSEYSDENYIPSSDPSSPIVGNWARTYTVSLKDNSRSKQMEVYSFGKDGQLATYYYAEGARRPFKKFRGNYLIENPLVILRQYKGDSVIPKELILKDCEFIGGLMACKGYHDPQISFRRWDERPDKLDVPCCAY